MIFAPVQHSIKNVPNPDKVGVGGSSPLIPTKMDAAKAVFLLHHRDAEQTKFANATERKRRYKVGVGVVSLRFTLWNPLRGFQARPLIPTKTLVNKDIRNLFKYNKIIIP